MAFCVDYLKSIYFYPRSPCGERLPYAKKFGFCDLISIHALLAESDLRTSVACSLGVSFLSTLSLRRATALVCSAGLEH